MTDRKELIARLRECHATTHTRAIIDAAADMLEADAQPQYGWLTACDEEMLCAHLGVANLSDSFESAKQKLGELIAWHVAAAIDPSVNGGLSLQPAVPQEQCWCDENNIGEPGVSCGDCPRDYAKTAPQPQRPRLTDEEITVIGNHYTDVTCSMTWDMWPTFARAIERKVRGEA